jgi:hypothetical protein
MGMTGELPQDWPAYKEVVLRFIEDVKAKRLRDDEVLDTVPLMAQSLVELADRVHELEEAMGGVADHAKGSKTRQVAALAGVGGTGLGISHIKEILEWLSNLAGAG